MKIQYTLYQKPNDKLSATQQILLNRGIQVDEQPYWLNANSNDFYPWTMLGERKMVELASVLAQTIVDEENVLIIVD